MESGKNFVYMYGGVAIYENITNTMAYGYE